MTHTFPFNQLLQILIIYQTIIYNQLSSSRYWLNQTNLSQKNLSFKGKVCLCPLNIIKIGMKNSNCITLYIMPKSNYYLVTKVMIGKKLPQTNPIASYSYGNTSKKKKYLKNYLLLPLLSLDRSGRPSHVFFIFLQSEFA